MIRRLGLASVVAIGVLTGAGDAGGQTSADVTYTASASAAAARTRLLAGAFPITPTPVDGGGPVAQAQGSSNGSGSALASFPYPGDIVANYSGTVAGGAAPTLAQVPLPPEVLGPVSTPPAYPFLARADASSQPEETTNVPGGTLHASATPGGASASGDTGSGDSGYRSRASSKVGLDGGNVVAHGDSELEGFVAGPLRIGSIAAGATVTLLPDGSRRRASSFDVSAASVNGVGVLFTPKGLRLADADLPAPDAVNQVLDRAGIKITFVSAQETPEGIVSSGIDLTFPVDFGGGIGKGALVLSLGQSSATISGSATAGSAATAPVEDLSGTGGGSDALGALIAPSAPVAARNTATRPRASASPELTAAVATPFDVSSFYPILFVAAFLLVALGRILHSYGMRQT